MHIAPWLDKGDAALNALVDSHLKIIRGDLGFDFDF